MQTALDKVQSLSPTWGQIQTPSPFSQHVHVGEVIWQTEQTVQNALLRSQHRLVSDSCSAHFNQCYIDCKGCFRLWCNCWMAPCGWSEGGRMELSLTISTLYDCLTNNSSKFNKANNWSLCLHLLSFSRIPQAPFVTTKLTLRSGMGNMKYEARLVLAMVCFSFSTLVILVLSRGTEINHRSAIASLQHFRRKAWLQKTSPYKNTVET